MHLRDVLKVLLVVICSMGSFAYSEENMAPTLFNVNVYEVAPGTEAAFEEVSAKFKAAADKVDGFPDYFGFSTAIGSTGQYAFASQFKSFGDLAVQRQLLAEVYDAEEVERLVGLIQKSVVSSRSFVVIQRDDLSIPASNDSAPEIVLSISIDVDRNKTDQFVEYLKNLVEATKATTPDVTWTTFQPGLGARGIWGVRISMKWADLDTQNMPIPERLIKHFGNRRGEKIFASGQDAINSLEYNVDRIRLDLSHITSTN